MCVYSNLGYNGVQRVGGVFGVVFGGLVNFFVVLLVVVARVFFCFLGGTSFGRFFLPRFCGENHCVLVFVVRFLFLLFGDECRRPSSSLLCFSFSSSLFLSFSFCLSLTLSLSRSHDDLNCATLGFPAKLKCICRIKISRNKLMI